jgi:transketolase
VVEAWKFILQLVHDPAVLVLTRQNVPTHDRSRCAPAVGLHRWAYVLADAAGAAPGLLLLASGSEVSLCVEAFERLTAQGIKARVVSMPSWEVFERQPPAYREQVLPANVRARIAGEQASPIGWGRYVGPTAHVIGMSTLARRPR